MSFVSEKPPQELHFKIPHEHILQLSRRTSPLAPGREEPRAVRFCSTCHIYKRPRVTAKGLVVMVFWGSFERPLPHLAASAAAAPRGSSRSGPRDPGRALPLALPRRSARAGAAPAGTRDAAPGTPGTRHRGHAERGTSQVGFAERFPWGNLPALRSGVLQKIILYVSLCRRREGGNWPQRSANCTFKR